MSIRPTFTDSPCLNRYLLDLTTRKLRSDIPRFFTRRRRFLTNFFI